MTQKLDVLITYLEQKARPAITSHPLNSGKIAILRAENPPVHFYRYLYGRIGDPHKWVSRKILSDDALSEIIHHREVYIYILYVDGVPAGLAEIDGRNRSMVEIKFFGLVPEYVGAGYGRYFLSQSIELAWTLAPERLILETCSLDHPAALPLYQKLGFTVFDQRKGQVEIPENLNMPHA